VILHVFHYNTSYERLKSIITCLQTFKDDGLFLSVSRTTWNALLKLLTVDELLITRALPQTTRENVKTHTRTTQTNWTSILPNLYKLNRSIKTILLCFRRLELIFLLYNKIVITCLQTFKDDGLFLSVSRTTWNALLKLLTVDELLIHFCASFNRLEHMT
jgi:DNA-directed RNA polymerase delta subunit